MVCLSCAQPPVGLSDGGEDSGLVDFDAGPGIEADGGPTPAIEDDGGTDSACETPCDDLNACTEDVCADAGCSFSPAADGIACGTGKTCQSGTCTTTTVTCPASCDDQNPCTQDACQAGTCVHPNAKNGLSCGRNQVCTAGTCAEVPATLGDYWAGRAFFERQSKFTHPSREGGFIFANISQDVEVWQGKWYLFVRELLQTPTLCDGNAAFRTAVCTSTDLGKTWTGCKAMVNPTPGETECGVNDGDVFKDPDSSTWHFLAQCIGKSGGWKLCHYTAPAPDGPYTAAGQGAGPVSTRGGDIWKKILGAGTTMHDEGTPDFVEKVGLDYFVTFHGIDSSNRLARGIAKTRDFETWTSVNTAPIFSKQDCDGWAVPWVDGNKCWGGGAATSLKEGSTWYVMEEASDLFGPCQKGQHWFWGLMRTTSMTGNHPFTQWSVNPMALGTNEPDNVAPHKTMQCNLAYFKLLKGDDGFVYLFLSRSAAHSSPNIDTDPDQGHYVFKLRKNAPRARWEFREGPGFTFTHSEIVAYGDVQGVVFNVNWVAASPGYALEFNGMNSIFVAPNNGLLNIAGDVTLTARVKLTGAPKGKSAHLAGRFQGYWLELYANGNLCAWAKEASTGALRNACASIAADMNDPTPAFHNYALVVSGKNTLALLRDGVELKRSMLNGGVTSSSAVQLTAGAGSTSASAYLGSFSGQLGTLTVSSP